jgi:hypothetical protein
LRRLAALPPEFAESIKVNLVLIIERWERDADVVLKLKRDLTSNVDVLVRKRPSAVWPVIAVPLLRSKIWYPLAQIAEELVTSRKRRNGFSADGREYSYEVARPATNRGRAAVMGNERIRVRRMTTNTLAVTLDVVTEGQMKASAVPLHRHSYQRRLTDRAAQVVPMLPGPLRSASCPPSETWLLLGERPAKSH